MKDYFAKETLIENLKMLRLEKNMTQEELAVVLGVNSRTISNIECGKQTPDCDILCAYAAYFNVDMNMIFGNVGTCPLDKPLSIHEYRLIEGYRRRVRWWQRIMDNICFNGNETLQSMEEELESLELYINEEKPKYEKK